ncbi:AbrB/MazE/SpoVT family DNA-binding domain-containing protein [Hydrogenophaga sp. ANAO-22]|jgi:bifunctional DNA-binding transcriptional regulator/antitoxin component of YhaV-PrlF toxin-antitoxin module|uniref:AbrB/MazE/SpoVT family DNA-binding domain-containing protein n=1 Tax=Hydrogenophaga sp. ANAO-22 TaxID=3166645 RepID=UPI0036D3462A
MPVFNPLSREIQISIPRAVLEQLRWEAGQELVLIPKGKGLMVMPAPKLQELADIAGGADTEGYRDRKDRY